MPRNYICRGKLSVVAVIAVLVMLGMFLVQAVRELAHRHVERPSNSLLF